MVDYREPICPSSQAMVFAVIAAFEATAIFNSTEVLIKVFLSFQHRSGIYFCSLLVASVGTLLYTISLIFIFFLEDIPWELGTVLNLLGWSAMVTGQSVVLWSRMQLITKNTLILRTSLAMIVINAIFLEIPVAVLFWGFSSPSAAYWTSKFHNLERAQVTIFAIQDSLMSAVYIRGAWQRLDSTLRGQARKVFVHLVWVNSLLIGLNIVMMAVQFTNYWEISANLKAFIYALRLKLAFAVLNKLMVYFMTKTRNRRQQAIAAAEEDLRRGSDGIFKSTTVDQESTLAQPSLISRLDLSGHSLSSRRPSLAATTSSMSDVGGHRSEHPADHGKLFAMFRHR